MKNLAKNLLTLAVTLLICFLLGELVMSFFLDHPKQVVLPEVKYQDHPVRWYALLPNQEGFTLGAPFSVNADGMRRTGHEGQPGATRKIVALGDSFTFGMGVADAETWPGQLEKKLNGSHAVVNAGVVGYGAWQIDELIKDKSLLNDTDVVIYALYWNDYMTTAPPGPKDASRISERGYFRWDPADKVRPGETNIRSWVIDHSFILTTLKGLFNNLGEPSGYGLEYSKLKSGALGEKEFAPIGDFLTKMQKEKAERGLEFVVVILPVHDLIGTDTQYDDIIRKMLEERGVRYFDGFELFDKLGARAEYFLPEKVDVHLNARGYDVLTTELQKMLVDSGALNANVPAMPASHSN